MDIWLLSWWSVGAAHLFSVHQLRWDQRGSRTLQLRLHPRSLLSRWHRVVAKAGEGQACAPAVWDWPRMDSL